MKTLQRELAETFALEHVLAGDIPIDKSFEEILEMYRSDENSDFGLYELYENCFMTNDAIEYIKNFADSVESLLNNFKEKIKNV